MDLVGTLLLWSHRYGGVVFKVLVTHVKQEDGGSWRHFFGYRHNRRVHPMYYVHFRWCINVLVVLVA